MVGTHAEPVVRIVLNNSLVGLPPVLRRYEEVQIPVLPLPLYPQDPKKRHYQTLIYRRTSQVAKDKRHRHHPNDGDSQQAL